MSNQFFIPPWVRISGGRYDWLSNTAAFPSAFTGSIRTVDRLGDRVAVSFSTQNASHEETAPSRAVLSALRARMRGQYGRIWYTDSGYTPRGSFPAAELITNNTFASGSTGWSKGSEMTLSVTDRTMRTTRNAVTTNASILNPTSAITVTQYAPYLLRAFTRASATYGFSTLRPGFGSSLAAADYGEVFTASDGMLSHAVVIPATSVHVRLADSITTGTMVSGAYIDVPWISLSRCALIDNGQNLLLQSDEFDTTWTTARSSVDDQTAGTVAPDGASTADSIIEDSTASNTHLVTQNVTVSSSALDYAYAVALKAGTRTWGQLLMNESTSGHNASAYFNLSTGVVGTVSSTGANWTNTRASISSLGNGWYYCCLVGRKVSASTTLAIQIRLATGDSGGSYSGDGASNIYAWRATLAQAGVPPRLVSTTTTATSGSTQTGPGYHTRGWPASTTGLLLPDDWVQIGSQLNKVVASVDSDASGRAYLHLAYPLRNAPSDAAPVVIYQPFGSFVASENQGGYDFNPEGSNHDFSLVEDLSS